MKILALLHHEERKGADHVEGGDNEDKAQEDVGHEFLYLHHAVHLALLFQAVEHFKLIAADFFQFFLHGGSVCPFGQFKFQLGYVAGLLEQFLRKFEGGEEITVVVFFLIDVEAHAGRGERAYIETFGGIGEVHLLAPARHADFERAVIHGAHHACQPYAGYAVVYVACAEQIPAVFAIENVANAGAAVESAVHAFERNHGGAAGEENKGGIFYTFGSHCHALRAFQFLQRGVGGGNVFACFRRYLYFGIESGIEAFH